MCEYVRYLNLLIMEAVKTAAAVAALRYSRLRLQRREVGMLGLGRPPSSFTTLWMKECSR